MWICLRVFVKWLETKIGWNLENYGFSICTSSTTCWKGWNDSIIVAADSIIETTCSTNTTSSIWMLLVTWSELGLGYSSMLPCMAIASSFFPPLPPISLE
jgi:hypothetical protein